MQLIDVVMLWVHLFSATFFVGGSFFFWLVIIPVSHLLTSDESERTQIIGKIAKRFGQTIHLTLAVLILTGLFNASWYMSSVGSLLSYPGTIFLTKIVLVMVLIVLIYVHNVYFGRRITSAAKDRNIVELRRIRRTSRLISAANLFLMAVILFLAVLMQNPI
jgi:putative copper resistance protein D